MSKRVSFVVAALGADCDPFMLHIYAAFAERERTIITARTMAALQALMAKCLPYQPGHPLRGSWDAGWHESDGTDAVDSPDVREPGFYWIDGGNGPEPAYFDDTGWSY